MVVESDTDLNVELIQQLCLEAGRIMEETSADMALVLPSGREGVSARIAQLQRAAREIDALATAARALVR